VYFLVDYNTENKIHWLEIKIAKSKLETELHTTHNFFSLQIIFSLNNDSRLTRDPKNITLLEATMTSIQNGPRYGKRKDGPSHDNQTRDRARMDHYKTTSPIRQQRRVMGR
jgi:hypothetical protein